MSGLSGKLTPILQTLVNELSAISWLAFIAMLCIGGVLWLMGNEYGAKKICKNALYGFIIIQVAQMLM